MYIHEIYKLYIRVIWCCGIIDQVFFFLYILYRKHTCTKFIKNWFFVVSLELCIPVFTHLVSSPSLQIGLVVFPSRILNFLCSH